MSPDPQGPEGGRSDRGDLERRSDGERPGNALVAVGVFAVVTVIVLVAALLIFAARHR